MAWRIFYATMLARAVPDMPCSVLLDLDEWQALSCAIHQCQPLLRSPRRWTRPCAGLPNSAALLGVAAATSLGRKRCGGAFNIEWTSPKCIELCGQSRLY